MEVDRAAAALEGPCVWLPAAQVHAGGREAKDGIARGPSWVVDEGDGPDCSLSCRLEVGRGGHAVLLQVAHRRRPGRTLGVMRIRRGALVRSESIVLSRRHPSWEWQRDLDDAIDGLLVNRPHSLACVLARPPYCDLYRTATAGDSQFVGHGLER